MTKNNVLEGLLKNNLEHIYLRFIWNVADPGRMPSAVQEHRHLVERMKKKDVSGSIEIIRSHVYNARTGIIAGISKEEKPIHL
jgi:DNA-binding GntR family transcriptional regulator